MTPLEQIWILGSAKFLVGAALGSFTVTCAMRVAAGRPWAAGRSACDHCQVQLGYGATLPLASFALAGGRCRQCRASIDPVHPVAELAGGLVVLSAYGSALLMTLQVAVGFCLMFLAVYDLKTLRIPNLASSVLLALGLAAGMLTGRALTALATAFSVWVLLALVRHLYREARGREGIGGGDVKLLAAAAAWLGPEAFPWALLTATAVAGTWIMMRRPPAGERLPFGPFIAAGVWSTSVVWSAT